MIDIHREVVEIFDDKLENITKYNGYPDFKLRPFSPTSPSTWEMYNECDHNQYIIDKSSFVTIDLSSDNE